MKTVLKLAVVAATIFGSRSFAQSAVVANANGICYSTMSDECTLVARSLSLLSTEKIKFVVTCTRVYHIPGYPSQECPGMIYNQVYDVLKTQVIILK